MKMSSHFRKKSHFFLFFSLFALFSCNSEKLKISISPYPDGKNFAFTMTDDPDYATLNQKYIVYGFLDSLGFKTTIAVWVLDNVHGSDNMGVLSDTRGVTTTNSEYLSYTQQLQKKGFEICLHTAGPGNDYREETQNGYEVFKNQFGYYPRININHDKNLENIYWGGNRFSNGLLKSVYGLINKVHFQGEKEGGKYFWGDICQEKSKYMRGWATSNINSLAGNPTMPFHEKNKPYVNWWFGCSDGRFCVDCIKLLSDKNITQLNKERGACIVYTHFGCGYVDAQGLLNPEFKKQLSKISSMDGWFVPASTILDRFLQVRSIQTIYKDEQVYIINTSNDTISGFTVLSPSKKIFIENSHTWMTTNNENELVLGNLLPHGVLTLSLTDKMPPKQSLGFFEKTSMIFQWIFRGN